MPACLHCARWLCYECHEPDDQCCLADMASSETKEGQRRLGRPMKADEDLKDPRSTNRKRAQKVCKDDGVEIGDPCEWRGLANVGLAIHPVVGCIDGTVADIHHVSKNTYDNSRANLAGVCRRCHNWTHTFIDPCTRKDDRSTVFEFATPRRATEEELDLWNNPARKHEIPRADHSKCTLVKKKK